MADPLAQQLNAANRRKVTAQALIIETLSIADRTFTQKRGQRLEDYLKRARSEGFRRTDFPPGLPDPR